MKLADANGFIIEQDFKDDDVLVTHTEDPGKAIAAYVNMVKSFIDMSPTFTVRIYAVQFEAEDKEGRDVETMRIANKNFGHCKAVQIGAFMQVDSRILVDLNAFVGPIVKYGHEGDDIPHTHAKPEE
jgi:hypothetical protein